MSYTANMKAFEAEIGDLQRSLTVSEEALLDLRDYEKRRATFEAEDDADLAARYGIGG